ncbi:MAG TPA: gliding motility-associated C-terminal domain-containing protein [Brumimicrobium sp.]|nr:gliding motility-associated C-terminal domain-containing protein [Brumimicrobium sp.]
MKLIYLFLFILIGFSTNAQLQASFTSTLNNICDGSDCDYEGPSILINEIMITPTGNIDGSLSGDAGLNVGRGEWIELYNPNICEPVDISCFYLGNNTQEGGGGYIIPEGTIVPAGGFFILRGANAPPVPTNKLVQNGGNVVEVIAPHDVSGNMVCAGGSRLWFPNAGGWFAFYDRDGVPQDAISWGGSGAIANGNGVPCVPTYACNGAPVSSLASYNNIVAERKHTFDVPGGFLGLPGSLESNKSIRRIPDGGPWSTTQGNDTYAECNDVCAELGSSTCDGTATINVTGGSGNYTYLWNDSEAQMTQTAVGLCEGTFSVIVTDTDNGTTETFTVEIENIIIDSESTSSPSTCGNTDGSITISGTDGAAPYTYSVEGGTATTNGTFGDLGSGSYNYVVVDANGCVTQGSQSIADVGGVEITSITPTHPTCFGACDGSVMVVVNADPTGLVFEWKDADGNTVGTNATAIDLCDGTYSITVTDANGCTSSESVTLSQPAEIDASFELTDFCEGHSNQATNIISTGGTFSITSPTGDGATINANSGAISNGVAGTTYTVMYETAGGCSSSTETVVVLHSPIIDLTASPVDGEPPLIVVFGNNTSGNNTYEWDFDDGSTDTDDGIIVTHSYQDAGVFEATLTATSQDGCVAKASVIITVTLPDMDYTFPNTFTPNGDGGNETWKLAMEENVASLEIVILNRWGNVVFESNEIDFEWNGKIKNSGAECSEGVYFYKAMMKNYSGDEVQEHGYIHIHR